MRPLRLLLSLSTSLVLVTLLLFTALGTQARNGAAPVSSSKKGGFKALFSFTSPSSLFPPSAIISLTDDNSTFFLARPAAFGPTLPGNGLSGPLWTGSGFSDDIMGVGELGCSDIPGWHGGDEDSVGGKSILENSKSGLNGEKGAKKSAVNARKTQSTSKNGAASKRVGKDDGTDDYLHLPAADKARAQGRTTEHADIKSLQEGAEIAGKVVLLKRGGCGFLEKVKWAQNRGGTAVIVGDDARGGALIRMYAHGDTSNISIPALFTSHTTAHLLSSLLPSGRLVQNLSPQDSAKLNLIKGGNGKVDKAQDNTGKKVHESEAVSPAGSSPVALESPTQTSKTENVPVSSKAEDLPTKNHRKESGWLNSIARILGVANQSKSVSKDDDSRRPPTSGKLDWVMVEKNAGNTDEKSAKSKVVITPSSTPASDFVIGEQDWRDPDMLAQPTSTISGSEASATPQSDRRGGSVLPSSGEYSNSDKTGASTPSSSDEQRSSWYSKLLGRKHTDVSMETASDIAEKTGELPFWMNPYPKEDLPEPSEPDYHEGLWVTLSPTNVSSSPFFDTLLVLVVSPLVTLTVVYALLLLRSRIRRRRWRAPKSVVERLPVRTYHTISDVTTPATATPNASSPTTPLLQYSPSQSEHASSLSRPRSRTASDVPVPSSSLQRQHHTSNDTARPREEEKRESGLAEWRRRYGGRQRECVVCLEEYIDGVSQVMSLPCGHEFHEECITPWLTTRRRTCPICKGDVVRSLSASYPRDLDSLPSSSLDSGTPSPAPDIRNDEARSLFFLPSQAESERGRLNGPAGGIGGGGQVAGLGMHGFGSPRPGFRNYDNDLDEEEERIWRYATSATTTTRVPISIPPPSPSSAAHATANNNPPIPVRNPVFVPGRERDVEAAPVDPLFPTPPPPPRSSSSSVSLQHHANSPNHEDSSFADSVRWLGSSVGATVWRGLQRVRASWRSSSSRGNGGRGHRGQAREAEGLLDRDR